MNAFVALLLAMLKANPQMLVSILEMLVAYLKANPEVTAQIIDQIASHAAPPRG